jgi:bacteriorhodopsin
MFALLTLALGVQAACNVDKEVKEWSKLCPDAPKLAEYIQRTSGHRELGDAHAFVCRHLGAVEGVVGASEPCMQVLYEIGTCLGEPEAALRTLASSCGTNLHGFLNPHDPVAISFWIISIAMVASTVFFLWESSSLAYQWKTTMNVGALVTLVAAVHYFYMREFWVQIHRSPIVYRYIDWFITVPLQMIEFYFILSAVKPDISSGMFWRLLLGTVAMLGFGYVGETRQIAPLLGFVLGLCGWGFILSEIFVGEAGQVAADIDKSNKYVKSSFQTMRFIVTVGWSIYPLGYFLGFLTQAVRDDVLNFTYNIADFVNKIAFCLAIWSSAKADTRERVAAGGAGYVSA